MRWAFRVWMGVLLLISGAAAAERRPSTYVCDVNQYFYTDRESRLTFATDLFYGDNFRNIPFQFGDWRGEPLEEKDAPYVSPRFYKNSRTGSQAYFMIVYGKIESDFHVPEVCYIDDGWSLEKRKYKTLRLGGDDLQLKYVRAEYGSDVHHIYYFFLYKNAARQISSSGAYMFRVSIRQTPSDPRDPDEIFTDFFTALTGLSFGDYEREPRVYPRRTVRDRYKGVAAKSRKPAEEAAALEKFLLGQMVPNPTIPSPVFMRRGLVLSYNQSPGAPGYRYTFSRSSIYDNAVAVIALVMMDHPREAAKIINGMMRSARPDGDLWFGLNTHNTWPDENDHDGAVIRTGANCWVGYAVCYYILSELSKNPNALNEDRILADYLDFAEKTAASVLRRQVRIPNDPRDGLVTGGAGAYVYEYLKGDLQEIYRPGEVAWCSTEHNIDAFFFLRDLAYITGNNKYLSAADAVRQGLLQNFNASTGQFNRGVRSDGPDTVMALDCASWGAMFLEAAGDRAKAKTALAAADRYRHRSDGTLGYKPYVDLPIYEDTPSQHHFFPKAPDILWNDFSLAWSEGSLGVAVAAARLGKEAEAEDIVSNMLDARMNVNGGIRYSDKELQHQFSSAPSAIGTAWAVLAVKSLEGGFLPSLFWSP